MVTHHLFQQIKLLTVALALPAMMIGCESTTRQSSDGSGYISPGIRSERPTSVDTTMTNERETAEPMLMKAEPMRTTGEFWWPGKQGSQFAWTNMAYPTGVPETSAIGIEKGVPRIVRLNNEFEYVIRVTNLSAQPLSDVMVTDQLGENFKFASSTPSATSERNGTLTWAISSLEPRETEAIVVRGTAAKQGTISSCATVTYNSYVCTAIDVVQPQLKLTKTAPQEVLRCEQFTYTLEIANTGTGTITEARIVDDLPQGVRTIDGKNTVDIPVGTLAAGQSRKYEVRVEADRAGKFSNTARAMGDGGLSAESAETSTMVRAPKLEITKSGPESLFVGRDATYEITVKNTGDGEARNAMIVDQLPTGAKFMSASDGGRMAEGAVQWNLGTLAPNASRKVMVTLSSDSRGMITNMATAKAFCASDVSATTRTTYEGIPAILLEVIDADDPIQVGENVTYVITATNQGSATGTNIKIACTLEENEQYVTSSGATTGRVDGRTISFEPLARLEPGKQAAWRVTVKAVSPGDVRFSVQMTSDQLKRPVNETEATNLYQ